MQDLRTSEAPDPVAARFHGEQDGVDGVYHPGALWWPGVDGLPLLLHAGWTTPPAMLTRGAPCGRCSYFRCRTFRTWDDTDAADYQAIMDRIANGWFVLTSRDERYDESEGGWRVRLEWVQRYAVAPPEAYRR